MDTLILIALPIVALLGLVASIAGVESRDGFDGSDDVVEHWTH
jgi:hypothetical protein